MDNYNNLHITFPSWFRDHQGQGCQIEGGVNKLNLKFQCVNDGMLKIILRGLDYRNPNGLRCPVYLNFTTFYNRNNSAILILSCSEGFFSPG